VVGQSTTDLLEFLDYTAEKGLMKKSTAQSLKAACNAVLTVIDKSQQDNVFAIDLDEAAQRYWNLNATIVKPGTLSAYRNRVKQAVSDFQRFKDDPEHWKPVAGQRKVSGAKRTGKSVAEPQKPIVVNDLQADIDDELLAADKITHRFPLRRDAVVRISGIPFDVTKAEMSRMTAFLSNLVAETDDGELPRLMRGDPETESAQR
jgi:hypothetical protein